MEYGLTGSTNLIYAGNDANVSVYAREEVVEDLCPMSVMLPFDRTIHSSTSIATGEEYSDYDAVSNINNNNVCISNLVCLN